MDFSLEVPGIWDWNMAGILDWNMGLEHDMGLEHNMGLECGTVIIGLHWARLTKEL